MRGGNVYDSDSGDNYNPVASVTTPHPALSPLRGEGALTTRPFHICTQRIRCTHKHRVTHELIPKKSRGEIMQAPPPRLPFVIGPG